LLGEKVYSVDGYEIRLNSKLIKTTLPFYILVPTQADSHQPIRIENSYPTDEKTPIFIDMINKQFIEDEGLIQFHQTQLNNPQLQQEQFRQEQLIKPLSRVTTFSPL
jgi:hypothetical protein